MGLILLLAVLGPLETALAFRKAWFPEEAYHAHAAVFLALRWGGGAAALLLAVWPKAREAAWRHLDGFDRRWLWPAWAGLFWLLFFLKYCQYAGCQLPRDTAGTANLCWNLLHHGSWASSVYGVANHFAVHFIPFFALMAPLLLLPGGVLPLLALQSALLASMPIAACLLAERAAKSRAAGLAALWLTFSSPYFFEMAAASVYPGMYLSVFFLWALVAFQAERKAAGIAAFAAMLATIEQACLAAIGLALYWIRKAPRYGASLLAGVLLLFGAELAYKYSFPESVDFRTFSMFWHGQTPSPLPALKLLLSTGFLPLLAPWTLVPWAVNFLPNFLADPSDFYHRIVLQYAGYVIGPLWWSMAAGLAAALARLEARREKSWLLAGAAALGVLNLWNAPGVLLSGSNRDLFAEVPSLAAEVPGDAALWASEMTATPLSARGKLKALGLGLDHAFLRELFVPDYVLISRDWPSRAGPGDKERVLAFLSREGYVKASERRVLVLLRHPKAPLGAPALELPKEGDAKKAAAFAALLAREDDGSKILALDRALAEKGDEVAQYNLGVALATGKRGKKDQAEALLWFKKAAAAGLPEARKVLGN
jgi:hypothetical protein